jgi:hypothetical protein
MKHYPNTGLDVKGKFGFFFSVIVKDGPVQRTCRSGR